MYVCLGLIYPPIYYSASNQDTSPPEM